MKLFQLLLATIFFFFSLTTLSAQNLIPNPGFEDENICKVYQEKCTPKAWRSNTLKFFLYYDYRLSRQNEHTLKPALGNRCISLRMFNKKRKQDRSFAQVPFLCKLERGKKYKLKFQMLSQYFYVNSFEVLFVDTIKIMKKNDPLLDESPQVKFEFNKPFPKNQWITLETIFEADGTEVGMMIGNFKKDSETSVELLKRKDKIGKNTYRVYHAFDDFSLTPLDSLEIECNLEKNKQYIYKDSVRHQYRIPPHSIQNIPPPNPTTKNEQTPTLPTFLEKPTEESVFIPKKIFTLSNILFETGSDKLLPIAYNSLDSLVVFLKENIQFRLTITGHTDQIGNPNDNLILSKNRAQSVANYLMARGIHLSRLSTLGKGESEPITTNITPEGRKLNRRVEFELIDN